MVRRLESVASDVVGDSWQSSVEEYRQEMRRSIDGLSAFVEAHAHKVPNGAEGPVARKRSRIPSGDRFVCFLAQRSHKPRSDVVCYPAEAFLPKRRCDLAFWHRTPLGCPNHTTLIYRPLPLPKRCYPNHLERQGPVLPFQNLLGLPAEVSLRTSCVSSPRARPCSPERTILASHLIPVPVHLLSEFFVFAIRLALRYMFCTALIRPSVVGGLWVGKLFAKWDLPA